MMTAERMHNHQVGRTGADHAGNISERAFTPWIIRLAVQRPVRAPHSVQWA